MLGIVAVMTLLAQSTKILWVTILWLMIEVGYRQDYVCVLSRLRIVAEGVVLNTAELAAVDSPLQYPFSYLLPVLRVARFVFGFNGHL